MPRTYLNHGTTVRSVVSENVPALKQCNSFVANFVPSYIVLVTIFTLNEVTTAQHYLNYTTLTGMITSRPPEGDKRTQSLLLGWSLFCKCDLPLARGLECWPRIQRYRSKVGDRSGPLWLRRSWPDDMSITFAIHFGRFCVEARWLPWPKVLVQLLNFPPQRKSIFVHVHDVRIC